MSDSQGNKIVEYRRKHGSITSKDAYREFDCMRLAAQIWLLREQGICIKSTLEKSKNRFGRTVCYSRYSLCE